jgi:hypothetical protein
MIGTAIQVSLNRERREGREGQDVSMQGSMTLVQPIPLCSFIIAMFSTLYASRP